MRGNCDAEGDQMGLEFPVLADYAVLPVWILLSICLKIPHEKKNHYLQGCSVKL